jgi:hypothetical protein
MPPVQDQVQAQAQAQAQAQVQAQALRLSIPTQNTPFQGTPPSAYSDTIRSANAFRLPGGFRYARLPVTLSPCNTTFCCSGFSSSSFFPLPCQSSEHRLPTQATLPTTDASESSAATTQPQQKDVPATNPDGTIVGRHYLGPDAPRSASTCPLEGPAHQLFGDYLPGRRSESRFASVRCSGWIGSFCLTRFLVTECTVLSLYGSTQVLWLTSFGRCVIGSLQSVSIRPVPRPATMYMIISMWHPVGLLRRSLNQSISISISSSLDTNEGCPGP